MGGLSNGPITDPPYLPKPRNRGVEKSPFEIPAKPRGCKSATTEIAHHVGSSSGLTTIVAMTLLFIARSHECLYFSAMVATGISWYSSGLLMR